MPLIFFGSRWVLFFLCGTVRAGPGRGKFRSPSGSALLPSQLYPCFSSTSGSSAASAPTSETRLPRIAEFGWSKASSSGWGSDVLRCCSRPSSSVRIDVHLTQGGWLMSQILELVSFSVLSEPVFATKVLNGLSEAFSLSFYND